MPRRTSSTDMALKRHESRMRVSSRYDLEAQERE